MASSPPRLGTGTGTDMMDINSSGPRFQAAVLGLVGTLRAADPSSPPAAAAAATAAAAVAARCRDLSAALRAATAGGVRLPAPACLQPVTQALKMAVEVSPPPSPAAAVGGTGGAPPPPSSQPGALHAPGAIAALSALEAVVRNTALSLSLSAGQGQGQGQGHLQAGPGLDPRLERALTDAFVLVLMTLDCVQSRAGPEQADDEECVVLCARCYTALLELLGAPPPLQLLPLLPLSGDGGEEHTPTRPRPRPPRVLSGPFLAQLIQAMLHFSAHRAKAVSGAALACLLRLIGLLPDPSTWRPFFPGLFSGLYGVATSGYKR
jgi:hypothetical protein